MAGREYLLRFGRLASRRAVVIALVAVCLAGVSLASRWRAAAERSANTASAPSTGTGLTAASLASLNGLSFAQSDGAQGAVLGEYEGYFDAKTRSISLQPKGERGTGISRQAFRSDPSGDVPVGPTGFGFRVVRSDFVNNADNPATVVGEIELTNNTSGTLYNTRVVFTAFKLSDKSTDAGNIPGASGFAYFNDGQVAYNNKLNVSRAYGDIAAGGKVSQIWSFAVGNTPPSFFFAYKVIADIGVAAESVAPAAVQVNGSTGTSVTIAGRGFTGTPTVELVGASTVALTGVSATATSITATVPAGTAAGAYSVRVTNPGGTPGGAGSSVLNGKLKVTGVPDGGHTLSGNIAAFADAGPYLVSGNATIGAGVTIPAGAVIYVASGAAITVSAAGNITADGGIPGVSATSPNQIVFTAQRSPGAAAPAAGAWGGINATSSATSTITMKNVVVEFGGAAGSAAINLTGSGRTLRFTDSIVRSSAGAGISAAGAGDSLVGFARSRVDNNGTSASDPAVLLSGNAALGLYDINSANAATSVGDPSYYYSSANDFNNNQVNAVRIGTAADAASNDFTKSGVLVGQGVTPIQIAGSCANPAIVGAVPPAPSAELTIGPSATIQLAADLNLQAGDYPSGKVGCIAANGYAGAYIGPKTGSAAVNKLISFDKIPNGGNFSSIFFSRNAMANCILNYVSVQNGGAASACSFGNGEVITEVIGLKVTNSTITGSATGGLLSIVGAKVDSRGSNLSGNATPIIDTIAGGLLGDGNLAKQATVVLPIAVAVDPQGRGIYVADSAGTFLIRFINTTRNTVTIGGQKIPAGAIRTVVGTPNGDPADNVPGTTADAGSLSGLAVSKDGDLLFWIDQGASIIRAYNTSSAAKAVGAGNLASGNVTTLSFSTPLGSSVNALAVNPVSGDIYVADATAGVNQVFKFTTAGGTLTPVAGNGATTKSDDAFSPGAATSSPLLQPRAITFDPQGNLYISDTGHARVIKVDAGGTASLLAQFPPKSDPSAMPYDNNPFASGLTFFNGKLYLANGNSQDIVQIDSPNNFTTIAGTIKTSCDYSSDTCGDGGPIANALFNLNGSTAQPPLVGFASDSKGLYVADQASGSKGRIRYLNLSAMDAEVAGIVVAAGNINTIAGQGLPSPFNGGLATSAAFNKPSGVGVDGNGNLWITDTLTSKLRFVNMGTTTIKIFAGTTAEQTVPPGVIVEVNKNIGDGPNDGAPVNYAVFDTPQGLTVTAQGIFIADSKFGGTVATGNKPRTSSLRFVNTTSQTITFYPNGATKVTVAPGNIAKIVGGSTDPNNVGDGANPLGAKLVGATDVAVHPTSGDIYIADAGNKRIRRVARDTGAVSTIWTGGANDSVTGISFDSAGRLVAANAGFKTGTGGTANLGNSSILREKASGQCATNAVNCFDTILSGGTGSLLKNPRDVVEGKDGALYVTNAGPSEVGKSDNKILRIVVSGTTGTASVYAGTTQGYSGDGGPAINAQLNLAADDFIISTFGTPVLSSRVNVTITIGLNGEIIFSDANNNAIRRIR